MGLALFILPVGQSIAANVIAEIALLEQRKQLFDLRNKTDRLEDDLFMPGNAVKGQLILERQCLLLQFLNGIGDWAAGFITEKRTKDQKASQQQTQLQGPVRRGQPEQQDQYQADDAKQNWQLVFKTQADRGIPGMQPVEQFLLGFGLGTNFPEPGEIIPHQLILLAANMDAVLNILDWHGGSALAVGLINQHGIAITEEAVTLRDCM